MSINPISANNYGWNYSKPDKPGYSTQLIGTVVAIQEVQKMGYTMDGRPGAPEFWPDGNPKMNIRLALCTQEGELKTFTFQPASRAARAGQKRSVHMDLFHLTGDTDMMDLIGKTICIQTQEGRYGQGNPRPWNVSLIETEPFMPNGPLPAEFLAPQVLANNAASGGQVNAPQPHPQYQQPQQYQPQPQYQQPQPQYQPQYQQPQQYQPQPQYQQPQQYGNPSPQMQQLPPQVAQVAQQYPVMNEVISNAMRVMGSDTQFSVETPQPQANPVGSGQTYGDVYDEDMPF